jgi:hypothetical protein
MKIKVANLPEDRLPVPRWLIVSHRDVAYCGLRGAIRCRPNCPLRNGPPLGKAAGKTDGSTVRGSMKVDIAQ